MALGIKALKNKRMMDKMDNTQLLAYKRELDLYILDLYNYVKELSATLKLTKKELDARVKKLQVVVDDLELSRMDIEVPIDPADHIIH